MHITSTAPRRRKELDAEENGPTAPQGLERVASQDEHRQGPDVAASDTHGASREALLAALSGHVCGLNFRAKLAVAQEPAPSARDGVADGVLYVGMNPDSEAKEGAFLAGRAHTSRVSHDATLTSSLETPSGVDQAVSALGVPPEVARGVRDVLLATPAAERGELMQIARVWSEAYRAGVVPSRLVLSGHSVGDAVYGESKGYQALDFGRLRSLAQVMPKAAAQIEDIQFAGCFTYRQFSTDAKRAPWLEAFPHVQTFWGYASKSPPAPLSHLAQWERGTRGGAQEVTIEARSLPFGVATWDVRHGYRGHVESKGELLARKRAEDTRFDALLQGRVALSGHYDPRADGPYQTCRKIEGRADVTPQEREAARARGDQYLRLRFYDQTRAAFARSQQAVLATGFAILGRGVPAFGEMDRREACLRAQSSLREIAVRLEDATRPLSVTQRAALEATRQSLTSFVRLDRDY
jgi:hypothetical protein